MNTRIHLSRKLEALVPKELIVDSFNSENPLDKWNATLFYVNHKKCIMLTNSPTKYTILLDRISKADFMNFKELFVHHLYFQFIMDEIKIDKNDLSELLGNIHFCETDNDQKTIGTLNYLLRYLPNWKDKYGHIDNWPFREINKKINGIPYKQLGWLFPKEKMKALLEDIYKKRPLN